ncbi:MAG TPA: hypothetical protein VE090_02555 [Methylomirabilota bacterium]|nr:hypothetical protein [Methylomirabilota bacterium]
MKIDKRILGVCDIASKESARPQLASVRFENGKAVATDGYSLMVIEQEKIEDDEIPKVAGFDYVSVDGLSLPAQPLAKFVKEIKRNKFLPVLSTGWTVRNEEGRVTLATTDLEETSIKEMKQPEGEYPNYQKVIDGEMKKEPVVKISFDPIKMILLLQAMVKAGATSCRPVTVRVSGDLNPIIITTQDGQEREIFALLMPMRTSE